MVMGMGIVERRGGVEERKRKLGRVRREAAGKPKR
jgi:hypothetical protein